MTDSGVALARPTSVGTFTVNALGADCTVHLRNGGVNDPIMWTLEADNAASSPTATFEGGLLFDKGVYVEFASKGVNSSAFIAVFEP